MATSSSTINAQMALATFYASFVSLIQQFKSWFNFENELGYLLGWVQPHY
jgi:hypothetical protein